MSDQTSDGIVRPEADSIEAMSALVEGARKGASNLPELLTAALSNGSSEAVDLLGRAGQVAVSGEDFLFLLKTERPAAVSIDDQPPLPMSPIPGTGYLHRLETLRLGTTHNFLWNVGGRIVGGMAGTMYRSGAGYNPGSYPIPGAAHGTLSGRRTITSTIYGGAVANY
jgi:hypothetical protein